MIELQYVTFLHVATETVSDLGVCLAKPVGSYPVGLGDCSSNPAQYRRNNRFEYLCHGLSQGPSFLMLLSMIMYMNVTYRFKVRGGSCDLINNL